MKRIKITRGRIELLAALILIICDLSVLTLSVKSKTTLTYDNGKITYTGYVVNHRMNGQGELTYENGDTYGGNFVDGVLENQGTFTSNSGWTYQGGFKGSQLGDQGILTTQNGEVCTGTSKQRIFQKRE